MQFLLDFSTDHLETIHSCSTWNENVHVVLGLSCHYLFSTFCTFSMFLFSCDTMTRVACGCNFSYSFISNFLKLCRCFFYFFYGLNMCICLLGYLPIIFYQLFPCCFSSLISIRMIPYGSTPPRIFYLTF